MKNFFALGEGLLLLPYKRPHFQVETRRARLRGREGRKKRKGRRDV
jgi:hypothetical protein